MMCLTSNKPRNRKELLKLTQRSHVILRPLLPQDTELQRGFFRALSEEARYFRFMTPLQELPPDMARRFANVGEQSQVALLACVVCGSVENMIGEARYIADEKDASVGEIAIAVADAWQGMGLGRILLLRLASHAAASGMSQLVGDTLASNARMVALARRCGFIVTLKREDSRLLNLVTDLRGGGIENSTVNRTLLSFSRSESRFRGGFACRNLPDAGEAHVGAYLN